MRCARVMCAVLSVSSAGAAAADSPLETGLSRADSALLAGFTAQFEEPLVRTAHTSVTEDRALLETLRSWRDRRAADDFRSIDVFLSTHAQSGWRTALLTNLGLSYYRDGYFSKAIHMWEEAWAAGKSVTTSPEAKALVDRAVGELVRMHARLGHAEELTVLLREIESRPVSGPATEAVTGAKEGLWMMRNEPGVAYLCGPMALKNLLLAKEAAAKQVAFLDSVRSGEHGMSLAQVADLASRAGLRHRLIFRKPGQKIPVPSIVHWKVTHFAAIVDETDDRFHIKDPTFGRDLWITRGALESESSGYFLVPAENVDTSWRTVMIAEAASVRGMGYTTNNDPDATTPDDRKAKDCGKGSPGADNAGMCGYNIHEMVVSLNLTDTPVGYAPPVGPPTYVTLTYNQREANQPATFGWFNVSQKWTFNWLSYIQDNPSVAGVEVMHYVAGGGAVQYSGYNSATGAFAPETRDASVLVRTSTAPVIYERRLPDGGREIYSKSNGATTSPRRIFLTKLVDRLGNAVTLEYDARLRLTTLTDATGRNTTFSYELATRPLLITRITDPFGRSARLDYDSNGRLSKITDVIGLTSEFAYDSSSLINAMTTPYGKTTFAYGGDGNFRWLNATDPLGRTERVEYRHEAPGIPYIDPASTVPQGMLNPYNNFLSFRNSYYWDKHAFAIAAGDYSKARITHWVHSIANVNYTGHIVESIKFPFENRVWYNYPGQPVADVGGAFAGTLDKPNRIGRVLDDGRTQLTIIEYNTLGRIARIVDPVGREALLDYDTNQIDLIRVRQKTSASGYSTIAQFTYNAQHLPLTWTDAAGQTSSYIYNHAGQLVQSTNALGQVTKYEYNALGYLQTIINPNNETAARFSYDAMGRVATRTDSEGHVVRYSYDALDRITRVTYPDGTARIYGWDKLDLASVTDRQGRVTRYAYNAARELMQITDPMDRKTRFRRYENGTLKALRDPGGNLTTWDIDLQSRVTAKHYSDGSQTATAFEATTSRVKAVTDALGQRIRYSYTVDDQLAGIDHFAAINATPNVRFSYGQFFRRITSMTDGTGTTTYKYQPLGALGALKLSEENGPFQNDTIRYGYDALSRVTTRIVDTSTESYTYDVLGRVTSHSDPLGTFDFTYLGQTGQLTKRRLRGGAVTTEWAYETNVGDRRLKSISNGGGSRDYGYASLPEDVITRITETAAGAGTAAPAVWDYTYDLAGRLLSATAPAKEFRYSYDDADNIVTFKTPGGEKAATYNPLNEVAAFNGRSFKYDANGNLVDDGVRTFEWDAEDRLIEVAYKAQSGRRTRFRYEGLGRRIAIVTNGVETRYLWCGEEICQARSGNDVISRRYYPEGELNVAGGIKLYYAVDHLGSVRDVLAENGARVASYDYGPYGNVSRSSGGVSADFRFAGMFYDQASGLYLTPYRAYDPATARWLSREPLGELAVSDRSVTEDPMGFGGGDPNLYAYTGGDPVNYFDPSGMGSVSGPGGPKSPSRPPVQPPPPPDKPRNPPNPWRPVPDSEDFPQLPPSKSDKPTEPSKPPGSCRDLGRAVLPIGLVLLWLLLTRGAVIPPSPASAPPVIFPGSGGPFDGWT